jgi:hypothetical protein
MKKISELTEIERKEVEYLFNKVIVEAPDLAKKIIDSSNKRRFRVVESNDLATTKTKSL